MEAFRRNENVTYANHRHKQRWNQRDKVGVWVFIRCARVLVEEDCSCPQSEDC